MPKSAQRYSQLSRVIKILNLLENSRYGKTVAELREDLIDYLGLSTLSAKTVSRDLVFLQDAGFHIEEKQHDGRGKFWCLEHNRLKIPSQDISVMELLSFAVGRQLLYPLAGTPYWHGIETLWTRIQKVLPTEVKLLFHKQSPGLLIRNPAPRYQEKDGILSALNRAICEHRMLQIQYRRHGKRKETRILEPHILILYQGSLFLLATLADSENDRSYRQFKLDRITQVKLLDRRFSPPENFDPQKLFASSIGVWMGAATESFRIRFTAAVAQWVIETPFHARQTVTELPDGMLEVTIPSAHEPEIIARVLSLGENAEVLEPASSREKIRNRLKSMLEQYQSPSSQ